jgi:hypothetical protein
MYAKNCGGEITVHECYGRNGRKEADDVCSKIFRPYA